MDNVIELELGEGSPDGMYAVRVLRSVTGGEPAGACRLDLDALLAERRHIEATVLASSVSARRFADAAEQPLRELGRTLFEAVFTGAVAGAYRASLGVVRERGESLQIVLRLTAPGLAALPWESMYDPEAGAYVARKEPMVRHVAGPHTPDVLLVEPPLRILGMVSAPHGLPLLDVDAEKVRLEEALRDHLRSGDVELSWLDDVSWSGLHAQLLERSWHVLHFIGHGGYDTVTDEGFLALEGPHGRADLVEASRLADLLDEADPSPRLVVLNACQSGAAGPSDLFSGTAAALVRSGIHAVTAMQFAVSDVGAIAFARAFYTAIARGRGIDEAVRSGRIGMLGMGRSTLEWVTPVLYLRGSGTQLFTFADRGPAPVGIAADSSRGSAPGLPHSDPGRRGRDQDPRTATVEPDRAASHPPRRGAVAANQSAPAGTRGTAGAGSVGTDRHPGGSSSGEGGGPRRRRVATAGAVVALLIGAGVAAANLLSPGPPVEAAPERTTGPTPAVTTVQHPVLGTQVWTDTGVTCAAGDVLDIAVTGTILHEQSATGEVGPEGLTDPWYHQFNVDAPELREVNTVAVIGSLDAERPFFVVGAGTTHTCERDGVLHLGVNDAGVANNSGQFEAVITRTATS